MSMSSIDAIVAWQNAGEGTHMNETPQGEPPVAEGRASTPSAPSPLVQRVLYMIVFAMVFWILCWIVGLTAVVQLVLRLLGGKANADLTRFGASVARYAREVIEYLTFASDDAPFPFRDWGES
jgi:hypothetical protein